MQLRHCRLATLTALSFTAALFAMVGMSNPAHAAVTSLSVDHISVASAEHTSTTVTGSLVCTTGHQVVIAAFVFQGRSGTAGNVVGTTPLTCTGAAQAWSEGIPVTFPIGGQYHSGPATAFVDAFDSDSTGQTAVASIVIIPGANNQ